MCFCMTICLTVITVSLQVSISLSSSAFNSPSSERYNFFDSELFKTVSQSDDRNLLISPVNIKLLLGMLMAGADGQTAEEIRLALRLPKDEDAALKEFDKWLSLLHVMKAPNQLKLANQVFISNRYKVSTKYNNILCKSFKTNVSTVDFEKSKETSHVINAMVAKVTSKLITNVVRENQIQSDAKMMLLSVVYFKGHWMNPFTSTRNIVSCFYTLDKKCRKTVMMTTSGYYNYGYVSRLDAEAIQFPYEGGKHSLLVLMPKETNGLKGLVRDFVHVSLESVLSELKSEEIYVQLPRFEISFDGDISDGLRALDLADLFSSNANFSRLLAPDSSGPLQLSHILHSAKILISEEGTEAASTTGALFIPLMGGPITSFVANRPFLFFILDSETHSVIFAGRLTTPKGYTQDDMSTFIRRNSASQPHDFNALATQVPSKSSQTFRVTREPQFVSTTVKTVFAPLRSTKMPELIDLNQSLISKLRPLKALFSQRPPASEDAISALNSTERLDNLLSQLIKRGPSQRADAPGSLPKHLQSSVKSALVTSQTESPHLRDSGVRKSLKGFNANGSDSWRRHALYFS